MTVVSALLSQIVHMVKNASMNLFNYQNSFLTSLSLVFSKDSKVSHFRHVLYQVNYRSIALGSLILEWSIYHITTINQKSTIVIFRILVWLSSSTFFIPTSQQKLSSVLRFLWIRFLTSTPTYKTETRYLICICI